LEFQDQAYSYISKNGQPLFPEEKALEEANAIEFDFLISLDEDSNNSKKRVRIYEEDDITIDSIKTTDYLHPQ